MITPLIQEILCQRLFGLNLKLLSVLSFAAGDSGEKLKDAAKGLSQDAAEGALQLLNILMIVGISALVGMMVGIAVVVLIGLAARRHPYIRLLKRRVSKPIVLASALFSAHLGLKLAIDSMPAADQVWLLPSDQILIVASILAATWFFTEVAQTIEDITTYNYDGQVAHRSQKLATQAQVLRRVLQAIIVFVGVASAILTFPSARLAVSSVLASAGLVSLVFGFAAQSTLGNMFAGLQLAFTDAIRVGDIVVVAGVDGTTLMGTVEEITLTYVVLHRWDERRVIVPSAWFTRERFENWTRSELNLLGTVELELDFKAPVNELRMELTRLLDASQIWDGRTANMQVTEVTKDTMTVRVVVSGSDIGNLWDIRCYLREHLIDYIVHNAEYCLPRARWEQQELLEIEVDKTPEEVAKLAEELVQIRLADGEAAQTFTQTAAGVKDETNIGFIDGLSLIEVAQHKARVRASKLRARAARAAKSAVSPERKSLKGRLPKTQVSGAKADDSTCFLYTGSKEAEQRAEMFSGPSEEVKKEREAVRQQEKADMRADKGVITEGVANNGSSQPRPNRPVAPVEETMIQPFSNKDMNK